MGEQAESAAAICLDMTSGSPRWWANKLSQPLGPGWTWEAVGTAGGQDNGANGQPTDPKTASIPASVRAETVRNSGKILSVTLECFDRLRLKFREIYRERSDKKRPTIRHYSTGRTPL